MNAALLSKLIEAGTPAELVAEVAVELGRAQAATELLEKRREKDRERKRLPRNSTENAESSENPFPLEVSPQTPLPKTPIPVAPLNPPKSRVDYQRFGDAWNQMAKPHGLPAVHGISGKRLKAVAARYAEHGEQALFSAINMVPNCPHWMGENGWLGNFDSLMRPDNFQRMIEGAYGPKKAAERREPTVAELRERIGFYERINQPDSAEECRRKLRALERPPDNETVEFGVNRAA